MGNPPSEISLLESDLGMLFDLATGSSFPIAKVVEAESGELHALRLVLTDLFYQCHQLACSVHALLSHDLDLPLIILQRGLFENVVNAAYLFSHADRGAEAVTYLSFTYLKEIKEYGGQPGIADERHAILARMAPEHVSRARDRLGKRPYTWSGKTFRDMAHKGGVAGYDELYGAVSGVAHGHRVGRYFRIVPLDGTRYRIDIGKSIDDETRETIANFARRQLHAVFRLMWDAVGGGPLRLTTRNPDDFLRTPRLAQAP